jgi:XRE family transcriptional regulator, regulator of sulfur utilization
MNDKSELSKTHRLLGHRIRQLRKEQGMTQEDLAFKIGVDRSYMGFVERGERNPTLDKIDKIARALRVRLGILFKGL